MRLIIIIFKILSKIRIYIMDNICVGIKKDGNRCTNLAKFDGDTKCGIHKQKDGSSTYGKKSTNDTMSIEGSTITLTYSECVESRAKMEKKGMISNKGFNLNDLRVSQEIFELKGYRCKLYDLTTLLNDQEIEDKEEAAILVIRNGISCIFGESKLTADEFFDEQSRLPVDKKSYAYGKVVNNHARYNLVFHHEDQEPDYENKKGRIISYEKVPYLNFVRELLPTYFGNKAKNFGVEGNYYYNKDTTYITYHGDGERKKVIAVRLGAIFPLHYQWFYKTEPIGKRLTINLKHGDMYVMSEKATGNDWKMRNILTLRHAAGDLKHMNKKHI